ncbi:MAG TPA: hypothetical protein VN719_16550 [Gemmatimonadales bacterium]|jgi:hypothetical protein|nr:hypothetical protein [Gemmatimonadales bacterium]
MISVHGGWWIPLLIFAFLFWRPWRWGRRAHYPWYGWPPPRHHMPPDRAPELDESVRARLELVDQLETRVTELENRLDFAERLLAERKEDKAISH